MKKFTFLVGKGDCGKSVFARHAIWKYKDKLNVVDGDPSNSGVFRFHSDVVKVDVSSEDGIISWIQKKVWPTATNRSVLLDLGGGRDGLIQRLAVEGKFVEMSRKRGIEVQTVCILTENSEGLGPVAGVIDAMPSARHHIVLNIGKLDSNIELREHSLRGMKSNKKFKELTDKHGCIVMPKCDFLMELHAPRITFSALDTYDTSAPVDASGDIIIGPWEVETIRLWLDEMSSTFYSVDLIGSDLLS